MKRLLSTYIFFLCSFTWAEIFEMASFKELENHLTPDTLLILDIDDTLLITKQMLGCDEWFTSRMRFHEGSGKNSTISLERALAEWEAVRHRTQMEIVEPGTQAIIHKLQEQGRSIMALSTQGLALATRTSLQLKEQDIDLAKTTFSQKDQYLTIEEHGILFRSGILFTSGKHKGEALWGFLDQIGYIPKRIVFVNDKRSHLFPVEEVTSKKEVDFVGLRYSYSDVRKRAFNATVADYQWKHSTFEAILSDKEAYERLGTPVGSSSETEKIRP